MSAARVSSQHVELRSRTKLLILFVFIFSTLFNLLVLSTPLFAIQLYTRVLTSKSIETLIVLSIVAIGALLFASFFDSVRRSLLQRASQRVFAAIGSSAIRGLVEKGFGRVERKRVMEDVDAVRRFVGGREIATFMDLPFTILFVAVLFAIHPWLGWLSLAIVGAMLVLTVLAHYASREWHRRANRSIGESMDSLDTFMRHASSARAFRLTGELTDRWVAAQAEAAGSLRASERRSSLFTMLAGWLRFVTQIIIMAVATYLVLEEGLNPGMIIASSILASRAVAPAEQLLPALQQYGRVRDCYRRVSRLVAELAPDAAQRPLENGELELAGVVAVSRMPVRSPVLKGVSLKVAPGECVVVMGPSGGGKTYLAELAAGAATQASGSVKIGGVDVRSVEEESVRLNVGFLPQEPDVLPGTVGENVARFSAMDRDEVWKALDRFGLSDQVSRLPQTLDTPTDQIATELSTGLYRRLLVARAFAGSPRLVVLDEPARDLDLEGEKMLFDSIAAARESGVAILVTTASPRFNAIADRTLVLRNGMIEAAPQHQGTEMGRRPTPFGNTVKLLAE